MTINAESSTNPLLHKIRRQIDETYRTRSVEGIDGRYLDLTIQAVRPERGAFVRAVCRAEKAQCTLEIGMASGLSTLFILEAVIENGGARPGAHVVIDPFQHSEFKGVGLRAVEAAGVSDLIEFFEERSELVLPRLVAEGRQFDMAFIDGDHRMDAVFLDLVLVNRLLKPGGVVVMDDVWFDPVYLACRFVEMNYGYSYVANHWRTITGKEFDGAAPTGIHPHAWMAALRKPERDLERDERHFVPFFDDLSIRKESRYRNDGARALRAGDRGAARAAFLAAVRLNPRRVSNYLRLLRTLPFWPVVNNGRRDSSPRSLR